jgi:four helix bundle protein
MGRTKAGISEFVINEDEPGDSLERLDLRTEKFAKAVRGLIRKLPRTISNEEDVRQLVRSSGSVAANFLEATEAVSRKDYVLRIKYCRKEAKESRLWLALVDTRDSSELEAQRTALVAEANELKLIFAALLRKYEK